MIEVIPLKLTPKPCTAHHHACACRELKFAMIEQELIDAKKYIAQLEHELEIDIPPREPITLIIKGSNEEKT